MSESKREQVMLALPSLILEVRQPSDLLKKILLSVVLSLGIALLSVAPLLALEFPAVSPFPESEYGMGLGSLLTLLFYLSLVIGTTFLIVFLLKMGKFNVLNIILIGTLSFAAGSIASVFIPVWSSFIVSFIGIELPSVFWYSLLWGSFGIFFLLFTLLMLKPKFRRARNGVMLLIGAWVGSFMSLLGELTPLVLMGGFALYDVFSVFKGPLGEMVKELQKGRSEGAEREEAGNDGEEIMLGLGDIVFYGIAASYAYRLSFIGFIAVVFTLLVGLSLTLYFLVKGLRKGDRSALPALPLPIFLSLAVIIVFKFLL
ncbi:MAG: hypothetical protein GWO20_19370 [Candidatus Korarchaeota archaeon]|nr:hypothetical protein [Candidatus Korarchaeota archaeon]NIU85414.1 hypothetical protein [Candidatus Thorarchaeota archaeon]NIW15511.1 hypothetical protein [Candidatus Thorarchaeota archaeon]NIW53456.1 hypothetical protein [Candidatus Korarchaeota archaeon]